MAKAGHNIPGDVLDLFFSLVVNDVKKQTESSLAILKYVNSEIAGRKGSVSDSNEVKYVISRVVVGLGSSQKSSRQGFFITLELLLKIHPTLVNLVEETLIKIRQNKGYLTSNESKYQQIGELMVHGALIRSGCLYKNNMLCSESISRIMKIGKKKSYLEGIALQFLIDLITNDNTGIASNVLLQQLRSPLSLSISDSSFNMFWIKIKLLSKGDLLDDPPAWLLDVVSHHNYEELINKFKICYAERNETTYPVIDDVIKLLMKLPAREDKKPPVIKFWKNAVVPLLNDYSAPTVKVILHIAQLIIPNLKASEAKRVLCDEFISMLMNGCRNRDECINTQCKEVCKSLLSLIIVNKDTDPALQGFVFEKLITAPGSVRFDTLTGTKLLQQSFEHLSSDAIKHLANILGEMMTDNKLKRQDKILSCHMLSRLVSHPNVSGEDLVEWRSEKIAVIMNLTFFSNEHPSNVHGYRDALSKLLNNLCKNLNKYAILLRAVMVEVNTRFKQFDGNLENSEEIKKAWKHVLKQMEVMQKSDETKLPIEAITVFTVLYAHMGFNLFVRMYDAKEVIEELDRCYQDAVTRANKKKRKREVSSESPFWVDIIIELLLSLFSKINHNWRSVVQTVFKNLCPMLTSASITAITDILQPEKLHQVIDVVKEASQDDDEDGDDRMVIPGDNHSDSDSESDDSEDDDDDDKESDSDGEKSDGEDVDDDDGSDLEEEVKDIYDQHILEMKKKMFLLVGSTDELDDVDMDSVPDDELKHIDVKLGALMGQFVKRKKNKKLKLAKDETQLMHFRARVCDLVDVYLEEANSMSHVLQMITPLISSYKSASKDKLQKPLQNRLLSLLNKFGHIKKFETTDGVTEHVLVQHMESLYDSTSRSGEFMTSIVGGCCSLLMHCGVIILGDAAHKPDHPLLNTYHKYLQDFIQRKDIQLGLKAFSAPFNLDYGGLWSSAEILANYSFDTDIRLFRRTQSLEILKMFFHNQILMNRGSIKEKDELMSYIISETVNILNNIESSSSVKVHFMSNLLELLRIIKEESSDAEQWTTVREVLVNFYSRIALRDVKDIKVPLNRLFQLLQLQPIKSCRSIPSGTKKNKRVKEDASDDEPMGDDETTKPKKRKWNEQMKQDELNKKKKSRKMWLEVRKKQLGSQQIDELESFSFATAAQLEINMDEEEEKVS